MILSCAFAQLFSINQSRAQHGRADEYPQIKVSIFDTLALADQLITLNLFNPFLSDSAHSLLLDKFGSPIVDIYAKGIASDILRERPFRLEWSSEQKKWVLIFMGEGASLISNDLEHFHVYYMDDIPQDMFDGRAIKLKSNGKIISMIKKWDMIYDLNDDVVGDSVNVEWTNWRLQDSLGNIEIIDMSQVYAGLDIYAYGVNTVVGSTGSNLIIDPLHGNSMDYIRHGNVDYYGASHRIQNEIIIMADRPSGREFYHFGGLYNDFTYVTDSVLALRAHDFNFISATDTSAIISFFGNGWEGNAHGSYSAGKLVYLNFSSLTAELMHQSILAGPYSSAMGSYDNVTNSIAPGVILEPGGFSKRLMVQLNANGQEDMRIANSASTTKFCFKAGRIAGVEAEQTVLRPTVNVTCHTENSTMEVIGFKEGLSDEFQFFLNGEKWSGEIQNGNSITLPISFSGEVNLLSRFTHSGDIFVVDKYSKPLIISEDYCESIGIEEVNINNLEVRVVGDILYLEGTKSGFLYDLNGQEVLKLSDATDISSLPSAMYLVKSSNGSTKVFLN